MVRDIVADLVRLADSEGMTPRGVSKHIDLLAKIDLAPGDITDGVLKDATSRAIEATNELLRRARHYNERFGMHQEVDEQQLEPRQLGEVQVKVRKPVKRGKVVRGTIFEYAATAILRWMGKQGWDAEDAGVCLAAYGLGGMSDSTIYIQLRAGKVGDATRGPIPELTKAQVKELNANRN
jgi:hypothetical protein